jgi:hypothetical protein
MLAWWRAAAATAAATTKAVMLVVAGEDDAHSTLGLFNIDDNKAYIIVYDGS